MRATEWYLIFESLIFELRKIHSSSEDPSAELYRVLLSNNNFVKSNPWVKKFRDEFELHHLDPLHIFSSFNADSQSNDERIDLFITLMQTLTDSSRTYDIDFKNCPKVQIDQHLAVRRKDRQIEIWDLFMRVTDLEKTFFGITPKDFTASRKWDGVDFASLTTFLFWIASDKFLPIDKYINQFLVSSRIVESSINTYEKYDELLKRIRRNITDEEINQTGLSSFRKLSEIAYNTVANNIWDETYSLGLIKTLLPDLYEIDMHTSVGQMGTRLVAIQALDDCNPELLGNLQKKKIYNFESGIDITDNLITTNKNIKKSFFDIKNKDDSTKLKLNVTAIVGKNGSGKSTLLELLFMTINNLSYSKREILKNRELELVEKLHVKLFYIVNGRFSRLTLHNAESKVQDYNFSGDLFRASSEERIFSISDLNNFFYTIVINHSHYSLNSNVIGNWIEKLFNKNDAYQVPIVINPKREFGNIDINNENHLATSRLLALLFSSVPSNNLGFRQITDNQIAKSVKFKLKRHSAKKHQSDKNKYFSIPDFEGHSPIVLDKIYQLFDIDEKHKKSRNKIVISTNQYLIRKSAKIAVQYRHYLEFFLNAENEHEFSIKRIKFYLEQLFKDESHITLKLRQAINYIKYYDLLQKKDSFTLDLDYILNKVRKKKFEQYSELNRLDVELLLPPSIFKSNIQLKNVNTNKISDFERLSSGEKQRIHSVSTILYHIKNIDSVRQDEQQQINSYSNINLILDEIELYYHPEMQREYFLYLINNLDKLRLKRIFSINICLVTHSPYILSDIPDTNILVLKNGGADSMKIKTFGANIHDLLEDSFFLEGGSIGGYAKEKINLLIDEINDKSANEIFEVKESIEERIEMIGDSIIKSKLREMFLNKIGSISKEKLKLYYQHKLDELND
ncbi:hypothetical protein [Reichenbachiella sp.]|uniref:hypothetical protein n=1 Tax=Reichenbachiella sp. TaxID=2184521 RepID=UPI003296A568